MAYSPLQKDLLRKLPKVDEVVQSLSGEAPRNLKIAACRQVLSTLRSYILSNENPDPARIEAGNIMQSVEEKLDELLKPSLVPLVNATGVVVHTNLGRSLLPPEIFESMMETAGRYSNLEYNLAEGVRGSRYSHVEEILCELTGAEAALVVNNNAAAVLITLETLAKGREVIVSRGELVEIGGSFRIPDVMARSGAILREVGATNRTHLRDYSSAICDETALLLKVHQSNFQVVGFTKSVSVRELSELGSDFGIPVYEDLGSGNLIDFSRYGMIHEPTVQESLSAGAGLVSFSGDKLLGGPQAGIIVGQKRFVEKIKKNPINRAVRIDKLTLAALEAVLRIYRDPDRAVRTVPTLRMLTMPFDGIRSGARRLARRLKALKIPGLAVDIVPTVSRVGGGALPLQRLDSMAVGLSAGSVGQCKLSAAGLEAALRSFSVPVITRIEEDRVLMDVRTLQKKDYAIITDAVRHVCREYPGADSGLL